jgi:hypothetical protein
MLHCCVASIQYNQLLPIVVHDRTSDTQEVDNVNDLMNITINDNKDIKDNRDIKDSNKDKDISSNASEEVVVNRNRRGATLIVNPAHQKKGSIMSSLLQKTSLLGNNIFALPITKVFHDIASDNVINTITDKSAQNNGENVESDSSLEKLKFVPSRVLFPMEISRLDTSLNILNPNIIDRKINILDKKGLSSLPSFLVVDLGEVTKEDLQVYIHLTTLPLISNFNRIFEGSKDMFAFYDYLEEKVQFSSDDTNISNLCPLG